jgi:hypothetical protein
MVEKEEAAAVGVVIGEDEAARRASGLTALQDIEERCWRLRVAALRRVRLKVDISISFCRSRTTVGSFRKGMKVSYVRFQRADGSEEVEAGAQAELGVDRLVWDKPLGAEVAKAIPSNRPRSSNANGPCATPPLGLVSYLDLVRGHIGSSRPSNPSCSQQFDTLTTLPYNASVHRTPHQPSTGTQLGRLAACRIRNSTGTAT